MKIQRNITAKRRTGLSTDELWFSEDAGLIVCWEVGRDMAANDSKLAERARNGELPILPWKGGVEKSNKKAEKTGCFRYLAMWQGLRNDDLGIDCDSDIKITCSTTGVTVTFTADSSRYRNE